MKRLASIILFIGVFLGISAQENTFRFGYLSYEGAIQSMPEYAIVQKKMKALQEQFQAETLRVEDEFNRKYEDFLDGQRDFPRTILQKRQTELQELMEKNIQFKEQGRQELADNEMAEAAVMEKYLPKQLSAEEVRVKIQEIIGEVGATSIKDMGKVMGVANKALAGLSDGRTISGIVKELLS